MNNSMDETIDCAIDTYWGELRYDGKQIDIPAHMNFLKEKYGEILEEYEQLYPDTISFTPAQIKEIYDIQFKTGLYKDYNPVQEHYRREVLKILAKNLQHTTIIDMGCEDGRITAGLALFGKNKVYGIDMNEYAIAIAEQKKQSYPEISDKIKFIKADYTQQEFYDQMKQHIPEGADTVLFVQPIQTWFYARHKVNQILKPEGRVIVTMMHTISNPDPSLEKMRIDNDWNVFASKAEMSYNIIEYNPFYKNKAILVGEMKR